MRKVAEQLKNMGADKRAPEMTREQAERLNRRAQELLQKASPKEREELRKLADELAKQQAQNGERGGDTPRRDAQGPESQRPEQLNSESDQQRQASRQPNAPGSSGSQEQPGSQGQPGSQDQPASQDQPGSSDRSNEGDAPTGTPQGIGRGSDRHAANGARNGSPGGGTQAGDGARRNPPVTMQRSPTPVTPVDVRPRQEAEGGGRVIADYFSRDNARRTGTSSETLSEGFREAAAGVERGIEQQNISNQHSDLVRRVFRRYVERTTPTPSTGGQPANSTPQPLPDAQDVPSRR